MIRAVFLDVDGTLVGRENRVSPRVRAALDRARDAGCEVVLCTGRSRVSAETIAEQIGHRGYAILSTGAVVMHLGTGEVLCRNVFPEATARAAVRALMEADLPPQVYEDAIRSARILYDPAYPVEIFSEERQMPWPLLERPLPFSPISVSTYGTEERVRPVAERMELCPPPGTFVQQSGNHAIWCLEVHHVDSGKCGGLRRITEHLGVTREETMAIGDHLNDLEMLRFAGVGVAMGNALPEAREAADWVTTSLDEDGVALAIERFVLARR